MTHAVYSTSISHLKKRYSGKVRDVYDIDDQHLLIISTDRLSAFDVIMPQAIPGKGEVLTRISKFWFDRTESIQANHLSKMEVKSVIPDAAQRHTFGDRITIAKKLKALPIEAIVRGYLIGSGWKDYQQSGTLCGFRLPDNLQMADRLNEPIYTPSTKATAGKHDVNISFNDSVNLIGKDLATAVKKASLKLFSYAESYALERGIIIADTKFEFGIDAQGKLYLIDEVLTPDSSRFWPLDQYRPGISPPSFDKQFVRDYLETLDWNKKAPGPELPEEIIEKTAARYAEAERRLIDS